MVKFINKTVVLSLILIASYVFFIGDTWAMGLSVDPARLVGEIRENKKISFVLMVYNDTEDPGIYDVYADDFPDWFEITPAQFRLYPGDNQKVNIEVKPEKAGSFVVNISVVGRLLNRKSFNAASGLKIPLTLEVVEDGSAGSFWYYIISATLIIFILLIFLISCRKKRSFWQKTMTRTEDSVDWLLYHNEKWYHKLIRIIKKKL